jgi:hypothetical protein
VSLTDFDDGRSKFMNFTAITVEDKEAAKAARDAYMRAAQRSRSALDRALAASYKAIAEGSSLIDIEATMRETPLHENGLPKLAIVRADFKEVFLKMWSYDYSGVMAGTQLFAEGRRVKTRAGTARIEFPPDTFPRKNPATGQDWPYHTYFDVHRAPVPLIPPQFRPADAYANYHILWEVDTWSRVAPKDPLLLRRVTGQIYAIVAQWNLTDLERLIMDASLRRSGQ